MATRNLKAKQWCDLFWDGLKELPVSSIWNINHPLKSKKPWAALKTKNKNSNPYCSLCVYTGEEWAAHFTWHTSRLLITDETPGCCSQVSKTVQIERNVTSYISFPLLLQREAIRSRCKEKVGHHRKHVPDLILVPMYCFNQCIYVHLPSQTIFSKNSTVQTKRECVFACLHLGYIYPYIPACVHGSSCKSHSSIPTTGCVTLWLSVWLVPP